MKTTLTAFALAATLAPPAAAVTFPSLTTIYVGSGVRDDQGTNTIATAFFCTNVSGVTASVRFLILSVDGAVAQFGTVPVAHGATHTIVTNPIAGFLSNSNFAAGPIGQGAVNIESTQSAVFCNALIMHRVNVGEGVPLHLVRVNPHPSTVE
jgi:hypothetical protein